MLTLRRDLKGEQVLRVVAGVDMTQLREASHEQSRADQQDERERRLRDDQSVPAPVTPTCRATPRFAQARKVGRRSANGRNEAACEGGRERRSSREDERADIEMHVADAR